MRHLRAARVRLVLVGGAPGAGKSTLAEALADRMGATLLRSDRVRKELAGIDPSSHVPAPFEQGIYDRAATVRAYDEILWRAGQAIVMGESVVIDASFASAGHRLAADELARRTRADCVELRCVAPTEVLASRLRLRHVEPATWSDADEQVGLRVAAEFDPWPAAFAVDTSGAPDTAVEQAATVLGLEPVAKWPRRSWLAPD